MHTTTSIQGFKKLDFMDKQTNRRLLWDGCYNVRDLGGYSTKHEKQTRWRAFVRADNLARLSQDGRNALISYGVNTIIDLRSDYELDIDPPPFAPMNGQNGYPQYMNLPLLDESDKNGMDLINQTQSLTEMYCIMIDRYQENIARVMEAFAKATNGTILFHCHSGRDRTGLIATMLLSLVGVDYPTIAKDYAISSVYIQPTFEKPLLEQPEIMLNFLAYLDTKYGGTRAYLLKSGMTEQDLTRIYSHLLG
jgi:protein-tyrosine phosphatase